MAREYARVKVAIWADSDFRLLSDSAQSLYFRLISSPTMSLCGVADWRPKRLAALTLGMTPEGVEKAASELQEKGYVVIDEDTEEVLVRSFIRHDGLIKTPNIAAAMAKDFAGTSSAQIRGVIVHELHRLYADEPGMKGWATASHLLKEPSVNPSGMPSVMASPNPSGMPSVNPSTEASANPSGNESDIPQPSSLNQQPSNKESAHKRATALPKGWNPPPDVIAAMHEECPAVDLKAEHRKFVDHWTGVGKPMKDWTSVWRNWIRRAGEFNRQGGPVRHIQPVPDYSAPPEPDRESLQW